MSLSQLSVTLPSGTKESWLHSPDNFLDVERMLRFFMLRMRHLRCRTPSLLSLLLPVLPAFPPLVVQAGAYSCSPNLCWNNTRWSSVHSLPSQKPWDHLACLHLLCLPHLSGPPSSVGSASPSIFIATIVFCELVLLALGCFSPSPSFYCQPVVIQSWYVHISIKHTSTLSKGFYRLT